MDFEYGELLYHIEVRWLSCGKVLKRFFALRNESALFMETKNKPVPLLADSTFQCNLTFLIDITFRRRRRRRRRRLKRYPLQVRHKQDWGRGFILLLPQTAALPGSDAGSDVIKPASSFVIQNRQTSCSMWCSMYRARC